MQSIRVHRGTVIEKKKKKSLIGTVVAGQEQVEVIMIGKVDLNETISVAIVRPRLATMTCRLIEQLFQYNSRAIGLELNRQ